jgi:hypothetical protein
MSQQSKRRAFIRGNSGINSTKVAPSSEAFRKGRFEDNPSNATIAKRARRQRKMDDPSWSIVHDQWVHASKTGV